MTVFDLGKFRANKRRVDENGVEWLYSDAGQKWVEVGNVPEPKGTRKRRKPFKADWATLPFAWAEALRQSKSLAAYRLAHVILFETFKREYIGGEIVLSSAVTKMSRSTRRKATKELVKLGLIELHREEGKAYRVSLINY